jgi:hypothetical protein
MCKRVGDQTSDCKLDKDWQFKYDHKVDKAQWAKFDGKF